jgi:magnesium-transporting ATPase (P-type)
MNAILSQDDSRAWHALSGAETARALGSDRAAGLSAGEAGARLARFGENALAEPPRRSATAVFVQQFKSPLIYLLLVAAGIAFALGHTSDAAVVTAVVLLNAVIGALQEGRAERALAALRRFNVHHARVRRAGDARLVPSRDVVPGDVLELEAGDAVCADARLLESAALQVAEAALTGESLPIAKTEAALAAETTLADRSNMLYAGTHVTAGRARAMVVATGRGTELGRIASLAAHAREPRTPLEERVDRFGRYVVVVAIAAFASVVIIGSGRGIPTGEILMIGLSQLVGVIPEGLPVAMTIALAVGVQRMARRKTVVRRLSAVETLGSTTVICSDKTGTLTRNEMTVTALHLPDGRDLSISGAGYRPVGELVERRPDGDTTLVAGSDEALRDLLEAAVLCNDAQLVSGDEPGQEWAPLGDPTEVALVVLALKGGASPAEVRARHPRRAELPFDPAAKLMATQHPRDRGSFVVIKGAPEVVLQLCGAERVAGEDLPLDDRRRAQLAAVAQGMAESALRVLAIAAARDTELDAHAGFAALAGRAALLGLVGQLDPPRPEARLAVARCRAAGIRPVMVTGDHLATGWAIAHQLGIADQDDAALVGSALEAMPDAELDEHLATTSVFARVPPAQKLRIVEAYQRAGEVVAMTGDGVNDAPALVKADVGVAMGQAGTEVAKEAAKIVIGDDNFATIVAAVEEGRVAYQNIKKALLLLFSTSAAEVVVLLLAMLLGYPPPFAAVQILWNNLVTEGVITVNLVMEPAEGDEMTRPPTPRDEPLLTRPMLGRLTLMVAAIAVSTLGWFLARTAQGVPAPQVQTETFTLLAICEWFNVLNCRSPRRSALTLDLFKNKWLVGGLVLGNLLQLAVVFWAPLGAIFHTAPFGWREFLALGLVGSLVLWVEELRKLTVRRRLSRAASL